MKPAFTRFAAPGPLRAILAREWRSTRLNRYFQIFCALSLLGGVAAAFLVEDAQASGSLIFEAALYVVSLFALLAGVGSAQGEREEWPMLLAQPVPRTAYVAGKFCALFAIFGAVLLPLFLPALFSGSPPRELAWLYLQTLLLAMAFLSCGLTVGFLAHDRSQAVIAGVSLWLFLLAGADLAALFAARWPLLQRWPGLWVAALMINPLDAFRIEVLFALQQIPAEAANKTPLAARWIAHASAWFALISVFWSAALVAIAGRSLNRREE